MIYDNKPCRNLFFVKSSKNKYADKTCHAFTKTLCYTITDYFPYFLDIFVVAKCCCF